MKALLDKLQRGIRLMIGRAVIAAVDDDGGLQRLQLKALADEVMDLRERFQEYGFSSHPHPGAEAILVSLGGNRTNTVVIAVDDRRYRLKSLAEGEVALYDDQDQVVHIKRNGLRLAGSNILLETDGVCRIDADRLELHGRTTIQRDVHGKGDEETWAGGTTWHTETYLTGATDTSNSNAIAPPALDSDHPDAEAS
ncbi:MAG: phage baseplate assembly protein V [Rhodospirillales bacterium]